MGKNPDKKKLVKAEDLIEQALAAVEQREAEASARPRNIEASESVEDESEAIQSRDPSKRESSAVGKIDIKQYVDREAFLRVAADLENFRKRAAKERIDAERLGREKILRGFLDILDNLERAVSQVKSEAGPVADGLRMILSQADVWLRSEGLERIESVGKTFDPTVHDAVSQVESAEVPAGIIISEIKRGYMWTSRLLRAASVVVSKGPEAQPKASEAAPENSTGES